MQKGKKIYALSLYFFFCHLFAAIRSLIPYLVKETPNKFPNTVHEPFEAYLHKRTNLWFDTVSGLSENGFY